MKRGISNNWPFLFGKFISGLDIGIDVYRGQYWEGAFGPYYVRHKIAYSFAPATSQVVSGESRPAHHRTRSEGTWEDFDVRSKASGKNSTTGVL